MTQRSTQRSALAGSHFRLWRAQQDPGLRPRWSRASSQSMPTAQPTGIPPPHSEPDVSTGDVRTSQYTHLQEEPKAKQTWSQPAARTESTVTAKSCLKEDQVRSQSPLTLCSPVDCTLPGSSVHGILQARILECVAISFSRGSSDPGIKTTVPALQATSFPLHHLGSPWKRKGWAY